MSLLTNTDLLERDADRYLRNGERAASRAQRTAEADAAFAAGGWVALNAYWRGRGVPALRQLTAQLPSEAFTA